MDVGTLLMCSEYEGLADVDRFGGGCVACCRGECPWGNRTCARCMMWIQGHIHVVRAKGGRLFLHHKCIDRDRDITYDVEPTEHYRLYELSESYNDYMLFGPYEFQAYQP